MFINNHPLNIKASSTSGYLLFMTLIFMVSIFIPSTSWALTSDRNQPINITADTQQVDMKTNKVIFKGNVVLTQGSIHLTANEVIVTRNNTTKELETMESLGNPARFSQKSDDGKLMKGQGNNLLYLVKKDQIILTTNAELHQDDSVIKGDKITYQIGSQKLEAKSGNGGRVTTIINPAQLEK